MLDLDNQVAVYISAIAEKALVKSGYILRYLILLWRIIVQSE